MGKQPAEDLAPLCAIGSHQVSPSYTSNVDSSQRARLHTNEEKTFWILNIDYVMDTHDLVRVLKILKRLRKNTKNNHML